MSKLIPRLRGKVFQQGAKWTWEIIITIGADGAADPIVMSPKDPTFLNFDAAMNDMRTQTPEILSKVCKAMGLPEPTEVLDLKAGESKTLEEFKRPFSHPRGPHD